MTAQEGLSHNELKSLLENDFFLPQSTDKSVTLSVGYDSDDDDLSWYRVALFKQIMEKIYSACGWTVSEDCSSADINILLSLNSVPEKELQQDETCRRVVVGAVRNLSTKRKEKDVLLNSYIRMREEDISATEGNAALARATVDFEMLHVGMSNCINLNFDPPPILNRGSSNRGIIFCLYNFARLATILRKHADKVSTGEYPPLPELDESLLSLLIDMKPERKLIQCCLEKFPQVLDEIAPIDKKLPQPHLLCRFLSDVSHPISRYYRTHHVLTDYSHLLPVMHARLHVLKAVHRVLLFGFKLLGVEPQDSM